MNKYVIIIASALLLLSCNENRNRGVQRVMDDVGCRMSEDSSGEGVTPDVIHDTIIVGDLFSFFAYIIREKVLFLQAISSSMI